MVGFVLPIPQWILRRQSVALYDWLLIRLTLQLLPQLKLHPKPTVRSQPHGSVRIVVPLSLTPVQCHCPFHEATVGDLGC